MPTIMQLKYRSDAQATAPSNTRGPAAAIPAAVDPNSIAAYELRELLMDAMYPADSGLGYSRTVEQN